MLKTNDTEGDSVQLKKEMIDKNLNVLKLKRDE